MGVKLFVGSLSFSTSGERLREAFARFGLVVSATVMMDRETGRSRGFGFVEMATPEEAQLAINALNGSSLDGRTIHVDRATPRGTAPGPRSGGERRVAPGAGGGERRPAPRPSPDQPPGFTPPRGARDTRGRAGERPRRADDRSGRAPGGRRPGARRSGERGRSGDDGGYRWGR